MIVSAIALREVTIEDGAGHQVGPFLVRPATVAEAIQILDVHPAASAPEEEPYESARFALLDVLDGWLPEAMYATMERLSPESCANLAVQHLSVGAEDTDVYRVALARALESPADAREGAPERSWSSVLADYRAAFHEPLADVLAEPWPLFLAQCGELDRIRARRKYDAWEVAIHASGMGNAGKWATALFEAAGLGTIAEQVATAAQRPADWKEKQQAALDALSREFEAEA